MHKAYPGMICGSCGKQYGRRLPMSATFYSGICGVCGQFSVCTEPRDYGHLRDGWQNYKKNPDQSTSKNIGET